MNASADSLSCYEDWQLRRESLQVSVSVPTLWIESQLKLLDYLIDRYRNSSAAKQPARFPLRAELQWNDRRILVHQYLGRGQVGGVKSKAEAESRVTGILQRMATGYTEEEGTSKRGDGSEERQQRVNRDAWMRVVYALRRKQNIDREIRQALAISAVLPIDAVRHLAARVADVSTVDVDAVELLLKCENKQVQDYCLRAWRERVRARRAADEVGKILQCHIRRPDFRDRAAEFMRESLGDDDAVVRVAAIRRLAEIGSLDDISLLSDLLALAVTDDNERQVMFEAMETIAEQEDCAASRDMHDRG